MGIHLDREEVDSRIRTNGHGLNADEIVRIVAREQVKDELMLLEISNLPLDEAVQRLIDILNFAFEHEVM